MNRKRSITTSTWPQKNFFYFRDESNKRNVEFVCLGRSVDFGGWLGISWRCVLLFWTLRNPIKNCFVIRIFQIKYGLWLQPEKKTCSSFPKVVDAWAQPSDYKFLEGVPEAANVAKRRDKSGSVFEKRELTAEDLTRLLDEAGVDIVMLSAWSRPGIAKADNFPLSNLKALLRRQIFGATVSTVSQIPF